VLGRASPGSADHRLLFQAENVVIVNTLSIVRRFLNGEDCLPDDEVEKFYRVNVACSGLYTFISQFPGYGLPAGTWINDL